MTKKRWCAFVVVALVALPVFGYSEDKPNWGDEKNGFILQYRLANGQKINYEISSKGSQSTDMGGQNQVSNFENFVNFTLAGNQANDPGKLAGQITINKMQMKTMQNTGEEMAELDRDLSKVIGKSFGFIFSPLGKELDFPGIEKLTVDMGPTEGGVRDVRQSFAGMLPDLSDKPVRVGDTWIAKDETTLPLGSYSVKTITETTSKVEGIEKLEGDECLKIHSTTSGTMDGSGTMMNMAFKLNGNVTAESTWYFAYKKGFWSKSSGNNVMKLMILVGGDQGMKIPMTINLTNEAWLAKPAALKK
jgi:hypothetical protein